jgi:glycine oxidase
MIGKPKIRIAGAGALGLAIALELADAGCKVEVFDPAPAASNASGVAAGMLAPAFETVLDPVSRDHFALLLAARDLWPALAARAGIALDREGALWVGPASQVEAHAGALRALGVARRVLSAAELPALASGLAADFAAGVHVEEDWRLDPIQAIGALRQAAIAAGVVFQQSPVASKGEGRLVVATGVAQGLIHLAPELRRLTPIKGHILCFPGFVSTGPVVRGEGVYAVPSIRGLIVGATMEPGVDDPTVDPDRAGALAMAGARLFPVLAGQPYEAAAGVRAATPDGMPMVGFGTAPDVVLAVGARRNGWLLAPLVARIVKAQVLGDNAGAFAELVAPGRFGSLI